MNKKPIIFSSSVYLSHGVGYNISATKMFWAELTKRVIKVGTFFNLEGKFFEKRSGEIATCNSDLNVFM